MKQTAVEWLVSELMSKGIINADGWVWDDDVSIVDIIKQAKEMEREQKYSIDFIMWYSGMDKDKIENAHKRWINETFKSE